MALAVSAALIVAVGVFVFGWHAGARSHGHLAIGSVLVGLLMFLGLSAFALFMMPVAGPDAAPRAVPAMPAARPEPGLAREIGGAAAKATKGVLDVGSAFFEEFTRSPQPPPKPVRERDRR